MSRKETIMLPSSCADCGSLVRARTVDYEIDGSTLTLMVTFEPHRCKKPIGISSLTIGRMDTVTRP